MKGMKVGTVPVPQPFCPATVIILTYSEELNLPHALSSVVGWAQ